jgi:uncharacterized paraquat-inducible protein A
MTLICAECSVVTNFEESTDNDAMCSRCRKELARKHVQEIWASKHYVLGILPYKVANHKKHASKQKHLSASSAYIH